MSQETQLVAVRGLSVGFPRVGGGWRRVVRGVSLHAAAAESVAVVGESGCGKSLTALALTRLIPEPGRIVAGDVMVAGVNVVAAPEEPLQELRGGVVGYVFQEPATALNPLRTVGFQVSEADVLRRHTPPREARRRARELLAEVGLERPDGLLDAYPHQISGGQRQRVLLAAALSGAPRLVVLDEPTSALDTTAQVQLLDLLTGLRERHGLALIVISHDLGVVRRVARRVTVLYAGETVEDATADELLREPAHPYTRALLACAGGGGVTGAGPPPGIPGRVPPPDEWGGRCRFADRCSEAFDRCRRAHPALAPLAGGRLVRCFLHGDAEEEDV